MNDLPMEAIAGFEWPTPAYLIGAVVFGIVGLAAFRYGRRTDRPKTRWLGVGLMLYPYAIAQTWLLYVVGLALCAGIWWDHRT